MHYTMYRPNVAPPGAVAQARASALPKAGARTAPAKDDDDARRGRSGKAAKKKTSARSLAKGERAPKGSAPSATKKRGGDRRKDAYGVSVDGEVDSDLEEHERDDLDAYGAKAAPKKPAPGKAAPSGTRKSPAPRPTAIASTSRRTAGAIRRPPAPPRDGDEEDGDHNHGKWAPPGTRHPAGLAIDLGAVRKRDGRWLSVASHFDGKIGQRTCGVGAPAPESANAKELWAIVCEARAAGVFTYALTPNFNQDHVDHVHFEIKPGVTWFLFH